MLLITDKVKEYTGIATEEELFDAYNDYMNNLQWVTDDVYGYDILGLALDRFEFDDFLRVTVVEYIKDNYYGLSETACLVLFGEKK